MRRGTGILVFARAPVPGRAKTRLAPRLGEWGAARLQARLTLHALRTAGVANCGPVELHGTPSVSHGFFKLCSRRFHLSLKLQRGNDLGGRMQRSLAQALRRHRAALLIGTDCPELGPRDLRRAARALAGGCDAVLAPAADGGYALIGLRRISPRLFEAVAWGGPDVYLRTAERLGALGWRWRALRTVRDVDRPGDLERLRSPRFFAGARRAARR